jgi:hypothetical protein
MGWAKRPAHGGEESRSQNVARENGRNQFEQSTPSDVKGE